MSKEINKDELENLEKPDRSFETRINKLEGEVGELGKKMDKINDTLNKGFEAVCNSLKEVVGDLKNTKKLEELTQQSERKD